MSRSVVSDDNTRGPAEESDRSEPTEAVSRGFGRRALVNSAQLGGSLLASWVMSLVGRFLLPRVLGTERFGELTLMEGVAALVLSLMAFGVHEFIGKEVAVDPDSARRFARPLFKAQLASGIALAALTGLVVLVTSGGELAIVAATFGIAQVNIVLGRVFAAYLQARHEAKAVSLSAVATKAIWLALLLACLGAGAELLALPLALVVSEFVRTIWLGRAFLSKFGTPDQAPLGAVRPVLRRSVPHYINQLNVDVMSYSVRILVGVLGGVTAAGLFSAGLLAASVPMLLTPVLGWVAIPVLASVRTQGIELMWDRVGSLADSLAVVTLAGGVALFALSDSVLPLLFGDDFSAAGPAFAWLALMMPATYFTQLVGSAFIADERSWQNTKVNLWTMVLVVVSVSIVLALSSDAEPGQLALRAAIVVAIGEWITVIALIVLRPFRALASGTTIRVLLVVGVGGIAAFEKLGSDALSLRFLAAGAAVLLAASDAPRLLGTVKQLLADR